MRKLILLLVLGTFIQANYSNPLTQKRFRDVQVHIELASTKYKVPYKLLKSMLYTESRFNPRAVSPTGPIGIAQLTKATAERYDVKDRRNAKESIYGMARAMRDIYNNTPNNFTKGERWKISAFIYNQGKSAYWRSKAKVLSEGYKPTYNNITLQLALCGENDEGLLYISKVII